MIVKKKLSISAAVNKSSLLHFFVIFFFSKQFNSEMFLTFNPSQDILIKEVFKYKNNIYNIKKV